MPKKYNIPIIEAPARFIHVGRSTVLDWEAGCLRCAKCVKRLCIYDAYNKRTFDETRFADTIDHVCKNCLRCVQMCPGRVITKKINPEYEALGDAYWTPEIISKQWEQAATGKIPVSGAGYRGPFSGPGFDDMWTDMSEIVRPTRDGIHGREYINTSVSLGRRPLYLEFDAAGLPVPVQIKNVEIPIPVVFSLPPFGRKDANVLQAVTMAAVGLGTLAQIPASAFGPELSPYAEHLVPVMDPGQAKNHAGLIREARVAALTGGQDAAKAVPGLKKKYPDTLLLVKVPLDENAIKAVRVLTEKGADIIELVADVNGQGLGQNSGRFVKDLVREVHLDLVEQGIRDTVSLVAGGGVAMAEHVAKAVICGADAVGIDVPLLLALECVMCMRCTQGLDCPVSIQTASPEWGKKRIMNLMAAWRNQILEVLGAMGIREVRRLRGEVGRAMFFKDLEADTFGRLFSKKSQAA